MMPAFETKRVEPAELVVRGLARLPRSGLLGDIALDHGNPACVLLKDPAEAGIRQIDQADVPAVIEQAQRDGTADALGGSGDDRNRGLRSCHGSGLLVQASLFKSWAWWRRENRFAIPLPTRNPPEAPWVPRPAL